MVLRLRWPDLPHSSKNRRRIIRVGGKPRLALSKEAKADQLSIRNLSALEWMRYVPPDRQTVYGDHDVAVRIRAHKREKWIEVEVEDLGPRRITKGRRRDLHGMPETIMDAIEGVAFDDDAQVARMEIEYVDDEAEK